MLLRMSSVSRLWVAITASRCLIARTNTIAAEMNPAMNPTPAAMNRIRNSTKVFISMARRASNDKHADTRCAGTPRGSTGSACPAISGGHPRCTGRSLGCGARSQVSPGACDASPSPRGTVREEMDWRRRHQEIPGYAPHTPGYGPYIEDGHPRWQGTRNPYYREEYPRIEYPRVYRCWRDGPC